MLQSFTYTVSSFWGGHDAKLWRKQVTIYWLIVVFIALLVAVRSLTKCLGTWRNTTWAFALAKYWNVFCMFDGNRNGEVTALTFKSSTNYNKQMYYKEKRHLMYSILLLLVFCYYSFWLRFTISCYSASLFLTYFQRKKIIWILIPHNSFTCIVPEATAWSWVSTIVNPTKSKFRSRPSLG